MPTAMKLDATSPAVARARWVLPQPGGYSNHAALRSFAVGFVNLRVLPGDDLHAHLLFDLIHAADVVEARLGAFDVDAVADIRFSFRAAVPQFDLSGSEGCFI